VSRRRRRIPRSSSSPTFRRDIACGVDPVRALLRAIDEFHQLRPGELWAMSVAHDAGCPSTEGGVMRDCTCEIVELTARRAA